MCYKQTVKSSSPYLYLPSLFSDRNEHFHPKCDPTTCASKLETMHLSYSHP